MFYSLSGKLIHSEPGMVVVECGGVGYMCTVSDTTLKAMPAVGGEVKLLTHLAISQDAVALYGFCSQTEKTCFRMLTGVSGIGSKTAISVLSAIPPEQIALAVAAGDYKTLTRANGVGPKQAQRIVLELKDKVKALGAPGEPVLSGASSAPSPAGNSSEAISALMVLGCSASQAAALVAKVDPSLPVEEIITKALQLLAAK